MKNLATLAFLLFFCTKIGFSQCLAGHFTVGGIAPDFPTVQAAIDTFVARGACDTVWFDIRPGIYAEQIEVKSSPLSFYKTIVLQPDPAFTGGEVRFTWPASASPTDPNYIVKLNPSPGFYLKNLDFERTNSAGLPFSRIVEIANGYVNTFDGCRFFGKKYATTTTDSTQTAIVANTDGFEAGQISFKNCLFDGGSWGFYLRAAAGVYGDLKVIDCQFLGQPSGALFAQNQKGFEVRRCKFDLGIDETAVALNFQGCLTPIFVAQNSIKTTGDGLRADGFLISDWQNQFMVAHNFFINPNGRAAKIAGGAYGTNLSFVWNSLRSKNGLEAGHLIESVSFNNQILIACGNIFDIENGPAMRLLTQKELDFGVFQSNCFVPKAGQPPVVEQVDVQKTWAFDDWQTGQRELYSVQKQVVFAAPDDLHIVPNDADLNGRGIGFGIYANEFFDIDGDALSANWPDIGADQFELPVANGSIYALSPTVELDCGQPLAVRFSLKNEGETVLTSALISWTIDGIAQTNFNWTGNLPIAGADTFEVGQFPVSPGGVNYFEAKILAIDGKTDLYEGHNVAQFLTGAGLAGDLTVGFGGDFETVFDLQTRLDQFGVCGPVRLLFLPGKFDGPLFLKPDLGLSATKTLEIAPFGGQKGAVFWESINFPNIRIVGAAHVSIHDMDFISGLSGSVFAENSKNISIENCAFRGPATIGTGQPLRLNYTDSATVRGCHFFYKTNGVLPNFCNGLVVENCRFDHDGNAVQAFAFNLSQCNHVRIEGCEMEGETFINTCKNLDFLRNETRTDVDLGGTALLAYGSDSLRVANNNFASDDSGDQPFVMFNQCRVLDFVHNSVRNKGFGPSFQFSHNAPDPGNSVRIENNIFVNDSFGHNYQWFCAPNQLGLVSNHNSFHVKGQYFANDAVTGISYFALGGFDGWWKTGLDSMSVLFEPPFFSKTDLRMVGNPPELAGKGLFLPDFSKKDLDGDPRPIGLPDIGADQFGGLQTDISVECNKPDPGCHGLPGIFFRLKNGGPNTARRVQLRWKINGDATKPPVVWHGELAAGESTDWLKLGEHFDWDFMGNDLEISATESRDIAAANDRFEALDFQNRLGGEYTVGGLDGDFRTLGDAVGMLKSAGVCGPVGLLLRPVLHENVQIFPIPGSSAVQNLTMEPEAGGTAMVKIIGLENKGGSFLRFHRLGLSTGLLVDPATDLRFDNCRFLDQFLDNSPSDDGLSFKNCAFEGSYLRIGGDPNAQTFDKNVSFENCIFGNNADGPLNGAGDMTVNNAQNFTMKNCRFERTANLYFQSLKGKIEVAGNVFGSSPGLTVALCTASQADPMLVKNNFFSYRGLALVSPSTLEGAQLDIFSCKNAHFLHNSMLFEPTNLPTEKTEAVYINSSTDCRFENNLVKTGGNAWAFGGAPFPTCPSDHNNFDLAAGGFLNGFPSKADWLGLTGFDQNSTLLPVKFEAENDASGQSTDLHLATGSPNLPLTTHVLLAVSTDFDDEIRGVAETIVGADEPNAPPAAGAVWPGDCDRDNQVSTLDWLHLGLAIGQNLIGPARADQSISWSPKFAADWPDSVQNVNAKHADCDGDGQVLATDTLAISQNFGDEHSILGLPVDRSGTALKLEIPAGPFFAGQKLAVPVMLGAAAEDFYGLAFDLVFSKNSIAAGSFWVDFQNSWLGQNGANSMGFYKKNEFFGSFPVALVKTDGQNANGFGQIGTLHFEVGAGADSLKIDIAGTRGIQSDGAEKPVAPEQSPAVKILVSQKSIAENTDFRALPNPTAGPLFLEILEKSQFANSTEITIFDALGKLVFSQKMTGERTELRLENLPNGFYQIRVLGEKGVHSHPFIIQK